MVKVVIRTEERIKKAQYFSWLMMGLCGLSLCFNVLFVLTMYQMGSRLTVMTQLFNTTRGTNSLVLSDILNFSLGDLDVLEKAFVRRYIEEKNFQVPEQLEMERRWGPYGNLAMMSHPAIFSPVSRNDERIKDVVESPGTHADNIQILSRTGHNWRVSFDLWTHTKDGSFRQKKEATVRIDFFSGRVQRVATPGFYYNPLGMTVTSYYVTSKD